MVLPTLVLLALIVLALAFWVLKLRRPSLRSYKFFEGTGASRQAGSLRVTFMGVTTLLFDDGETAILTDGFFSRPGKLKVGFCKIGPNEKRIAYALKKAGIDKLSAVLTAHSHYDHALDSAVVAQQKDAELVGSKSTAKIASGIDFPVNRLKIVEGGESFTFGRFHITVIKSPHSPGGRFMGNIDTCLHPPVRVKSYQEGGNYSYLIEHGKHRILFHPSANFPPNGLTDFPAEVVFLGIGVLGNRCHHFAREYWQKVVRATGAKVVVPTHWDDFTRSLKWKLKPWAPLFDKFKVAMGRIEELAKADKVAIRFMPKFRPVDISELSRPNPETK